MASRNFLAAALTLAVAAFQLCSATTGTERHRSLVLIGSEADRQTYSKYVGTLEALGSKVDVRLSSDKKLQLRFWDDWLYESIIILDPKSKEFGGSVSVSSLLEFVDAGNNLLLTLDSGASEKVRELAIELGVDVEPSGSAVIDHFSHDATDASHTTVLASGFVDSKAVFGGRTPGAVVFKGIGLSVSPESTLTFAALWASPTAYSATRGTPLREEPNLAGAQVTLTALSQPRTGGRVAVLGSVQVLSNAAFGASVPSGAGMVASGNKEFAAAVTSWLLHQRGVLKFGDMEHRRPGSPEQPAVYRIKDQAEFSIHIQELVDGTWQPYRADDVQLEFVMLDPYVRATLQHDNQGTFSTHFQVPDVYGVFKFVIEYGQTGYNKVELSKQIAVRPYRHNEFDRFLVPAYPYYTTALTTMLSFAVLTLVFLYS